MARTTQRRKHKNLKTQALKTTTYRTRQNALRDKIYTMMPENLETFKNTQLKTHLRNAKAPELKKWLEENPTEHKEIATEKDPLTKKHMLSHIPRDTMFALALQAKRNIKSDLKAILEDYICALVQQLKPNKLLMRKHDGKYMDYINHVWEQEYILPPQTKPTIISLSILLFLYSCNLTPDKAKHDIGDIIDHIHKEVIAKPAIYGHPNGANIDPQWHDILKIIVPIIGKSNSLQEEVIEAATRGSSQPAARALKTALQESKNNAWTLFRNAQAQPPQKNKSSAGCHRTHGPLGT